MKNITFALLIALATFTTACASGKLSTLEDAQFAMDNGDFTTAITKATEALAADTDSIEAAHLLGLAYFGRSGLDFLDIAEGLTDLANNDDTNFAQIAALLPDDAELADLRLAIETLAAIDNIDDENLEVSNENLADAAFDLAMMQAIEHFAVGVYQSGFKTGTTDVTAITDDDAEVVQSDLLLFDNHLIGSGVDSTEDFISQIRQTFCILEPISAGEGFATSEYQAFVGCQLEPDTFDPTDVNGDIANCAALIPDNQSAEVQACFDVDTSL